MFSNSRFDRVRQLFVDQFTPDGNGYFYRKSYKGAQFRVSKAERDSFIADFNRRIRYSSWSTVAATIILVLLVVWLVPDSDSTAAKVAVWIGVGAILCPFLLFYYWAWNAPARELQHRMPAGAALTKIEARALAFSKITYGQLVLAAAFGVWLVWSQSLKTDVFHGLGLIWLAMGGGLILLSTVQAFRKWHFSHRQAGD
ncbi:hypothetical protein ACFFF7_02005 [Novosphingobium aquiterrae]|uniref:DUF3278 domain-containing protein n=1 Tax=Novosphingobium aquiterrae TaxID=624388 RepID=A0ABV6PEB9_9SPHN